MPAEPDPRRRAHEAQLTPQDVADNLIAYFQAQYGDRPLSRLAIVVNEERDDIAQLVGRRDGKLQFLATLDRDSIGWEVRAQLTCDELWVSA